MKQNGLHSAQNNLNQSCYKSYVDVVFVLFESAKHRWKFGDYFNTCHPNMPFSFEQEKWKVAIS